jgi:polyribonucleotide nucleotidyltransferase
MVESEASELPEDVMLGAVMYGHEQMQAAIRAINELADEGGKDDWDWEAPARDEVLIEKIRALVENDLNEAYRVKSKAVRSQKLDEIQGRRARRVRERRGQARPTATWCAASCMTWKRRSSAARS